MAERIMEPAVPDTTEIKNLEATLSKHLLLANVGGVSATLFMVGPLLQNHAFTAWIVAPISFFLGGAGCSFLFTWSLLAGALHRLGQQNPILGLMFARRRKIPMIGETSIPASLETIAGARAGLLLASGGLFALGAICGAFIIWTLQFS